MYQNLSEEEKWKCVNKLVTDRKIFLKNKKKKKCLYGGEQYKRPPEDEKQRLIQYREKKL